MDVFDFSCSIKKAVEQARQVAGFALKIEVECHSTQDALEALEAGAQLVMLDHVSPTTYELETKHIKQCFPHALIEISGNITFNNVHVYFSPYVDVISMGCLTQGVPHVDFSLKITSTLNGC
ncbi:hypothetical protein HMI56_004884 [Coelomomyces lativittatus]|nr:hypothetical protein HMI56_004884 [Coelomomyces lativittatus]